MTMITKVGFQSGNEVSVDRAEVAIKDYLREHGCILDNVRMDKETGEVQFETPTGFKVIVRYFPHKRDFIVILC